MQNCTPLGTIQKVENDYDMDCNENVDEASDDAGDKVGRKKKFFLPNNLHASTCSLEKQNKIFGASYSLWFLVTLCNSTLVLVETKKNLSTFESRKEGNVFVLNVYAWHF